MKVDALNGLDLLACDIHNEYLTDKCREKIWTIACPEFGSEDGSLIIVKMELYGLKPSGPALRANLDGVLHDLLYVPYKADPDVWMRPEVRKDGSKYYQMALCYINDVLVITTEPMKTIDGIRAVFKPKDENAEKPDMYLGASLSEIETANGTKCWTMSSEKYVKAAI